MSKISKGDNLLSDIHQAKSTSVANSSRSDKNSQHYCNHCDVYVCGKKNYQEHLNGQKHRKCTEEKEHSKKCVVPKTKEKAISSKKTVQNNSTSVSENKMRTPTKRPVKSLSLKRAPTTTSRTHNVDSFEYNSINHAQKHFPGDRFQNFRGNRGRIWNHHYSWNKDYSNNYQNYNSRNYQRSWGDRRRHFWDDQGGNYPSNSAEWYREEYGDRYSEIEQQGYAYSEFENNVRNSHNHKIYDNEHESTDNSLDPNRSKAESDNTNRNLDKELESHSAIDKNAPLSKFMHTKNKSNKNRVSVEDCPPPKTSNISNVSLDTIDNYDISSDVISSSQTTNISSLESSKQQDKRVTPENMTERISHWLNPLNSKDKAEVSRLVTEFSKSKKKENLLKLKLRSEHDECNEDNAESSESLLHKLEYLQDISVNSSSEHLENRESDLVQSSRSPTDKTSSPKTRKRKKSSLSESNSNLSDSNDFCIISDTLKSPLSRSASVTENCSKEKRRGRKSRNSIDLTFPAKQVPSEEPLLTELEDIFGKRRNCFNEIGKSKKHKCSASECLEKCVHEELKDPHETTTLSENLELNNEIYCSDELCPKQESSQIPSQNLSSHIEAVNQEMLGISINNTEILDVEELMKMFAVKNITIKKEFDDPLIDAIQNIDINLLLNVCDQQQIAVKETPSSNIPMPQESPVHVSKHSDSHVLLPADNLNSTDSSKIESFEASFPGLSPYNVYMNISNELKKLQTEEEDKRSTLRDVDKMIEKFQKILNELTARKIKLQIEEDNLISRRNGLTCALSQCIIQDSFSASIEGNHFSASSSNTKVKPTNSTEISNALVEAVSQIPNIADPHSLNHSVSSEDNSINMTCSTLSPKNQQEIEKDITCEDDEEILIIPQEITISDIPVIDLVDLESPNKKSKENMKIQSVNFYEKKNLTAHETVVNSLKIFGDYMYTCSNDYTAKRFDLKDCSHSVTYKHSKRNVLQLCVETFNDLTLVFTLCSTDRHISSFKAKDGVVFKTYCFDNFAVSISNSWGKVFAGLKSGTIMFCNQKESKELVRNFDPIKSIACTFQGGLHVLVILTTNGQVAVRDVDRNGLLIRYVKSHSDTPLFMNVYSDYVYLSSSIVLTVTNLSSGSLEHKIKLSSPITGLTANESNIFTTSFSGIVRCYPDRQEDGMKMAYGAGKNSLTCICVNQGWVFTGNRNGEIAVFKFDPSTEFHCRFNKCRYVFTQLEDLERHVLSGVDHKVPQKNCKCPWRGCQESFTKDYKQKERKNHLKDHVTTLLEWKSAS